MYYIKNYCDYQPSKEIDRSGAQYMEHLANIWKKVQSVPMGEKFIFTHIVE